MKIKLIYNPHAGNGIKLDLDTCVHIFQDAGYETTLFRCGNVKELELGDCDALAVSGGDGTINTIVNEMMKRGINVPLGIIPAGTANDVASHLGLERDVKKSCEIIASGKTEAIDIGLANDTYFTNVCAVGLFNVSQSVDKNIKQSLGKVAYYIKGIERLTQKPPRLKITTPTRVVVDDFFCFMALNTKGTGGFNNLSPFSSYNDGLFDFIGIKAVSMQEFIRILIKVFNNEYLDDPSVTFFRADNVLVEADEPISDELSMTDIDGEAGPKLPVRITNIKQALRVFCP